MNKPLVSISEQKESEEALRSVLIEAGYSRLRYLRKSLMHYLTSECKDCPKHVIQNYKLHTNLRLFLPKDNICFFIPVRLLYTISIRYYWMMIMNELNARKPLTIEDCLKEEEQECCPVCHEEAPAWQMFPLPCSDKHRFHLHCLNQIAHHSQRCPLCRKRF